MEPLDVVTSFCEAWEDVDLDRIVGFFTDEIAGGLIAAWRDYFDLGQFTSQLG